MTVDKLASAIISNVLSGLPNMTSNRRFTKEQVEDEVVNERLKLIKEYALKNLIPKDSLMMSLRCVSVDCESIDRCVCTNVAADTVKHFQIPQVITDFGAEAIDFVGSTDLEESYYIYTNRDYTRHQYKRRGKDKPYVFIDTTPNKNNMYDGFVFNASPLLRMLTVRFIPKDLRQLVDYGCCDNEEIDNVSFLDADIEQRLTEKFLRYYRQNAGPEMPNDQTYK